MRAGVADGLELSKADRQTAFSRIWIHRENSKTRKNGLFEHIVLPLVESLGPVLDFLWMDCASAYHGGSASDQENVTDFLRHGLQPILSKFRLGGVMLHHSNKPPPTKEQKADWSGSDFAYLGAGAAEWAQYARAIITLRTTNEETVFELRGAKRGRRLNWADDEGKATNVRHVAWTKKDGQIFWRPADSDEIPEKPKPKPKAEPKEKGRPKTATTPDELAKMLKILGTQHLTHGEWKRDVLKFAGITKSSFDRMLKDLVEDKKVSQSDEDHKYEKITTPTTETEAVEC